MSNSQKVNRSRYSLKEILSDEWDIRVRFSCAWCFIDMGVRSISIKRERPSEGSCLITAVLSIDMTCAV